MTRENALIIFDWDDTLFPTTWVVNNDIKGINNPLINLYASYFDEVDKLLSNLLISALSLCRVIIITNANMEWIRSTKLMLPKSSAIIDKYIEIISARDNYVGTHRMDEWKQQTFKYNITEHFKNAQQIISIGDDIYEYNALISLKKYINPKTKLKVIKFIKMPTYEIFIDQLNVLLSALSDIYMKQTHLDLKILLRQNK